ncbi:MAG: hypothetical protein LQ349_009903 [Xanthoria aureola]|nr:MAG: hypothetical protein LQ349_009903 [Xanthoria aureola]
MASGKVASGFKIPPVTQEDLATFQKIHFGPSGSSTNAVPQMNAIYVENEPEIIEEDDLGYYPDGVKRTLTDEQIAMFRHSEIYALQRKRQLRKENQETEDGLSEPPADTEIQPGLREQPTFDSPKQSVDHFMKHYGPGGKNRCDFHTVEEILTDMMDFNGPDGSNGANITGTRKRRKADNRRKPNDYRDTTSRRQARELDDAAAADTGLLDYGEEPSVIQSNEPGTERVKVEYADHDSMVDVKTDPEPAPPKEGRKIWWPTIG